MDKNAKLYFQINPSSGVPIYRQIVDQVRIGMATERFKTGDYLPSVREVSASLEVNLMTVSKAYSLLEKEGIIEFVRGQGMRIPAGAHTGADVTARKKQLTPLLKEVVNVGQQLSLDINTVIKKLKEVWEESNHD